MTTQDGGSRAAGPLLAKPDCGKCGRPAHKWRYYGTPGTTSEDCDGYEPMQEELPAAPTMADIQRQLDALLVQVTETRGLMDEALAVMKQARHMLRGLAGMRS